MTPDEGQGVMEWTPHTLMEPTHHLYGRKCGSISKDNDWTPCRGKARYISTLGHCATVLCEHCYQRRHHE